MKVAYDPETDSLTITMRESRIKESDEVYPGVILDLGYDLPRCNLRPWL